jgi:hypothetical protein
LKYCKPFPGLAACPAISRNVPLLEHKLIEPPLLANCVYYMRYAIYDTRYPVNELSFYNKHRGKIMRVCKKIDATRFPAYNESIGSRK